MRFLPVKKNYKYFSGYFYDDYKIKPLHLILPKTSAYVKSYNCQTKWKYFFIEVDYFLEKYFAIWNKVSADIDNLIANLPTIKKIWEPI